ncbi:hypothetical protein HY285_05175 [Candidatus Peregrinibacteria bacterium]|nr:hypothetical protein [Candidatus Peregrinibacteria bacterium]MBI3816904.1 hypothetical protein [Candidatus Peregrinibacteria bacterium]
MRSILAFLIPHAFAQLNPHLIPPNGLIAGQQDCNFITGEMHFHCIPLYVAYLIQLVFSFIGTIALLVIIWSGYELAISSLAGGDSSKAKGRLRYAIMGFVVSILAYFIVNLIIEAVT